MPKVDATKIAIVFADDTIGIMSFVTAEYHPRGDEARWRRDDTDEEIAKEIAKTSKSFSPEKIPVKRWHRIDERDIPVDRTYRNALRHDGKSFSHDIAHARRLHRDLIRQERAPEFAANDMAIRDAMAEGDQNKVARAIKRRDALRDATKHPAIEAAKTTEELKGLTLNKVT